MKVTSKQTLIFRVPGQKNYVLHPTKHPVSAPEYIRSTSLYKLAISDGTVEEFVPVAVPVTPSEDDKAKAKAAADAKAKADAEQAAFDAKAEAEEADAKADAAKDKKAK
jgi:hypothetical protein